MYIKGKIQQVMNPKHSQLPDPEPPPFISESGLSFLLGCKI